jgi:hypothetical protein
MASVYENLGKQMVEFRVGVSDLENKVNQLTAQGKIKDQDARDLVTGFVDEALKEDCSPATVYSLVHGFARWLYNGDFSTVRNQILENMAKTGKGINVLRERGDEQGMQTVAKLAMETNPSVAFDLYKGEGRNDLLRQIADKYAKDWTNRETVQLCLRELDDTDGLRQHAITFIEKDTEYSVGILKRLDTDQDYRTIVAHLAKTNLEKAYDFALNIQVPTQEDKTAFENIRKQLINKMPEHAVSKFLRYKQSWQGTGTRVCTDTEGMIAAGKRLLEQHKIFEAADAFTHAEYEGPELLDIGLELLKMYKKEGSYDRGKYKDVKQIMAKAAPAFIEKSPETVDSILDDCKDDTKRKLGIALAKRGMGIAAYRRIIEIKDKTPADISLIGSLRQELLSNIEESRYLFAQHDDAEGMRMFVECAKEKHPEYAYYNAVCLKDESLISPLREAIIAKSGLRSALLDFAHQKDKTGVKIVLERIAQGVDSQTVDYLLDLKPKKEN